MSNQVATRLWAMRGAFVLLVVAILFFRLLPLQTEAGGLIWPDFILTFALAWSARRPDYVPAVSLAACFLLADLLLQRPPGLQAMLALIACERIKKQSLNLRDASFATEVISVSAWIIGVGIVYRVVLALFLVDTPPIGLSMIQIIVTVAAYPLVVGITHGLMGVRKASPGDLAGGVHT